jgi:hypothetical protein
LGRPLFFGIVGAGLKGQQDLLGLYPSRGGTNIGCLQDDISRFIAERSGKRPFWGGISQGFEVIRECENGNISHIAFVAVYGRVGGKGFRHRTKIGPAL